MTSTPSTTGPGDAAVIATTLGEVRNGSIIRLRFGHAGTVTEIGPRLRACDRGLQSVTVSELIA